MSYLILVDGTSAAIVFGGTALGTVLRCGAYRSFTAISALAGSLRPNFNANRARSQLALQMQDIHRNGLLRAEPRHFGDAEFNDVTDALIEHRSARAVLDTHQAHKDMRVARSRIAVSTFAQAAELAPVFGLVGTLIALSQLSAGAAPGTLMSNSIPMAIVTTFYGLITANLLFAPLARFIERRADKEEAERQKLVNWLAAELERETSRPAHRQEKFAA